MCIETIKKMAGNIKSKAKKIAIAVGVVGVVVASGIALQPKEIPFIEVNGQKIEFPYTDKNSKEDLIIRTDKQEYSNLFSWDNIDVYVMVENKSGIGQVTNLQFYFPNERIMVNSIKIIKPNSEYETTVEKFSTTTVVNSTTSKEEIIQIKTGEYKETRIGNVWQDIELLKYDKKENDVWLTKGNLKEKPKLNQKADKKVQKLILNEEISYFKVNIQFPQNILRTPQEFYIETIGSEGGYGLLDPTIFEDNFNSYNDGDLNGQGSWSGDVAYDVQGTTTCEGAKAVQFSGVGGWKAILKTGNALTDGVVTYAIRSTVNNQAFNGGVYLYESITGNTGNIWLRDTGYIGIYSGGGIWTDILAYSADTWYWVQAEWRSSDKKMRARAKVVGGSWSEWTGWVAMESPFTTSIDTIRFRTNQTSGTTYWDYVAEEPYSVARRVITTE